MIKDVEETVRASRQARDPGPAALGECAEEVHLRLFFVFLMLL